MNTFHLVISTPDGNVFDGDAANLSLRAANGDVAIMAGHIPYITSVRAGKCTVICENGEKKSGESEGGLLTVASDKTTLLVSTFKWN